MPKLKIGIAETDLAGAVVEYLNSHKFDCYQEVSLGRGRPRADIIATRPFLEGSATRPFLEGSATKQDFLVAVEVKTSLNITVLEQAFKWDADHRYIAIPYLRKRDNYFLTLVCQGLEIGVLEVRDRTVYDEDSQQLYTYFECRELIPAPLHKCSTHAKELLRSKLHPLQKVMAQAGSRAGKYYTPYQGTIRQIQELIRNGPVEGITIADIMRSIGKAHYSSLASCRGGIQHGLATYEKEWCMLSYKTGECRYLFRGIG